MYFFCLTHSPLNRPQPPIPIHVLSTACDIISFNGQGQLYPLTCAEWRDLSKHTRMSTIQSRTQEKKAKHHVTLTWKFPWKSCSTTHLPFLSSNPKILKAFLKPFPPKWSLLHAQHEKKKWGKKSKKRGEERRRKVKTAVSLLNPKTRNLLSACACQNFASWYFASGSEGR